MRARTGETTRWIAALVAAALLLPLPVVLGSGVAGAAEGDLDTTFGDNGTIDHDVTGGRDVGEAMTIMPDGKVVVVGWEFLTSDNDDFVVVRYNTDGTLDNTFGGDGVVSVDFVGNDGVGLAAVAQPDGKVVVAGRTRPVANSAGATDLALARLDSNGALDATFGTGGLVVTDVAADFDEIRDLALQPDGKIVAVGFTGQGFSDSEDLLVLRYNADGTLDSSFAGDGIATPIDFFGANDSAEGVAVDSTGRLVVSGWSWDPAANNGEGRGRFSILRFTAAGSLDTTFDADGIVHTEFFNGAIPDMADFGDFGDQLIIQDDDRIVVAGSAWDGARDHFAVARYDVDGSLDSTFDGDGKVTTDAGTDALAFAGLAQQQDGKLVVAGQATFSGNTDFAVVRYDADGSLDTTFSGDGIASAPVGAGFDSARDMGLQADGRIVLAGTTGTNPDQRFAVARFEGTPVVVNAAPVATDDAYGATEDTALIVDAATGVLANDTDGDADPLTAAIGTQSTNGTVSLNADGSFTYTPDADFSGIDTFTYTASDGNGGSDTATVTITVAGVNDAPVAAADGYTATENTPLVIGAASGVLANDTDVDGDPLTAVVATGPTNGNLVLNADGSFTYTPDTDFTGGDGFTYTVSDGNAGTDTGTVTVTVEEVNDAPVATDDGYVTDEDTALVVIAGSGVLVNDTDPESDTLTANLGAGPANGTLSLGADGSFTYTPDADFSGTDTFTYTANDGVNDANVATVTITVTGVNDAPVAVDNSYATAQDTPLNVTAPGVLGNDTDADGDALTAVLVSGPSNGTLTLNADGSFTYTPEAAFTGSDSFTYRANDGTVDSGVATVTLTVSPPSTGGGGGGDTTSPEPSVDTSVEVPPDGNPGPVETETMPLAEPDPTGDFELLDVQVEVSAPDQTAENPLLLDFGIDLALLPPGRAASSILAFRDGVLVRSCNQGDGADPDPCLAGRTTVGDIVKLIVRSSRASTWTFGFATTACPSQAVPSSTFTDLVGNVHAGNVDCSAWWGIVRGVTSSTFDPGASLRRDQMASLLARLLSAAGVALPDDPEDRFVDDDGNVHELAINQLAELGLVSGTGPGTFSPSTSTTRGQAATLIVAAFEEATGQELPVGVDAFADDDGNTHEANIDKAAAAGLVLGQTSTEFAPRAFVRRDQMGSLLARLLTALVEAGVVEPPLD